MNEKLRNHIETLFEDAPKSRKAFELKEELLANSEERYQDLIANGVTPDDAFKHVVSSIGNVSELFKGLEVVEPMDKEELFARTKKVAVIKTAAVGLYIFSVAIFLAFAMFDELINNRIDFSLVGLILMIIVAIIPTCMLVYVANLYPPYLKTEDTIVEDFKEWKSVSKKSRSVKGAVICVLWTSTVLVYFAVSFITFAWYATWIIFLAAVCLQAIIELVFRLKEMK